MFDVLISTKTLSPSICWDVSFQIEAPIQFCLHHLFRQFDIHFYGNCIMRLSRLLYPQLIRRY